MGLTESDTIFWTVLHACYSLNRIIAVMLLSFSVIYYTDVMQLFTQMMRTGCLQWTWPMKEEEEEKKRISQSWNTLTHYIKLLWVRWAPDLKILKRPTIRTENLQNPRWCHDGSHLFPSIFKDHAVLVEVPERTVNHWASANFLSLSLYENQCSWTLLHCNQGNSAQSQHITDRRALPANASNNSRRARRRTEATRPNHFYTVNQEDVLLVLLKYQIGAPVSVMT